MFTALHAVFLFLILKMEYCDNLETIHSRFNNGTTEQRAAHTIGLFKVEFDIRENFTKIVYVSVPQNICQSPHLSSEPKGNEEIVRS